MQIGVAFAGGSAARERDVRTTMRIAIIAPGSRGDIQPYIALGEGLHRAGHDVRVVTNKDFEGLVRSHGLSIRPVDIDIQAAMQSREASAAIEGGGLIASFRKLAELAKDGARKLMETGLGAAEGADAVVAGFGGMLAGASIAEKLGIPLVQAYNVPFTPTAEFPGVLFPWMSVWPRAVFHRLSHWLTRQVIWQMARSAGNAARTEIFGLPPAPFGTFSGSEVFRRGPLLYGLSPSVIGRPADWDANIHVTGYWFTGEPEGWTPPRDLVEFLDRGPAPVYVGFGSMSSEKPEATMRLVLDAVARSGRRAVVHSGWAGLRAESVPDDVLVVGSVPHSWLFRRAAAIVHHGGAGTTAAAFRAGVPSVVVPFHGDQPFWGRLTTRLGVGTRPIPRRRLTSERLAAAIEEALTSDEMREKAAGLGEQVRREDGVATAVRLIERAAR